MRALAVLLGVLLFPGCVALAKDNDLCRQALSRPVEPDAGLRACTVVINANSKEAWAYASRGSLHLRRSAQWEGHEAETGQPHDLQAALSDLDRAIELDPDADYLGTRGLVHIARARFYRKPEELQAAVADFNRALEVSPKSKWLLTQRGVAHEQLGEREKAIADFKLALSGRTDEDARDGLRRLNAQD